jgi:hypothetical protein
VVGGEHVVDQPGELRRAQLGGGAALAGQDLFADDEPASAELFSTLVHVTQQERAEISASIRRLLFRYRGTRPADAVAVTAEIRLHTGDPVR